MKPPLLKKYWATWRGVLAYHIARGLSKTEADAQRDGYCIRAHGRTISAAEMTDDEGGDVIKEFNLILHPDSISHQLQPSSSEARQRAQCIWSITKEQPHPGWAAGACQDMHGRRDWKNLPYADLLRLRRRVGNDARGYVIPGGNSRSGKGQNDKLSD